MSRSKLIKYQHNLVSPYMIQTDTTNYQTYGHLYGCRQTAYFDNAWPIILELGCGKAEHGIYGARHYPHYNRIGVDIKWDRLYQASKIADQENLHNLALLRVDIHNLYLRFAPGEVAEILLPYPDPRPKDADAKRRLTYPLFLQLYAQILQAGGYFKFKTDDENLYTYSQTMLAAMWRKQSTNEQVWLLTEFAEISSQFSRSKWPWKSIIVQHNPW